MLEVMSSATAADWLSAWTSLALAIIAFIGFGAAIVTLRASQNRQKLELEGYVRVDIGPPGGTADFQPPEPIVYRESGKLEKLGTPSVTDPVITVWYRNLQAHPLGIALGVVCRVEAEIVNSQDVVYVVRQEHRIPYIEPGRCVQIDVVQFPASWRAQALVRRINFRGIDGDGIASRHGRWECIYNGFFSMTPQSDPNNFLRDILARVRDVLLRRQVI